MGYDLNDYKELDSVNCYYMFHEMPTAVCIQTYLLLKAEVIYHVHQYSYGKLPFFCSLCSIFQFTKQSDSIQSSILHVAFM